MFGWFEHVPVLNKLFAYFKKCSQFHIWVLKLFSFKFLWTNFKKCSGGSKHVPVLNKLFANFKKCWYLQVFFGVLKNVPFPKMFANLKNVRFFKFCSGVSKNVRVVKLFVFPYFVLKFKKLFVLSFLGSLKMFPF